ncbi:MAG: acylphosphatase [Myxococcota bacterium]|nr:acylphosphatase [Myxococcota bacterium]
MERIHVRVLGRVQGVYYRASTRDKATDLGLVGWVRNCSDGTVELVAEGQREDLQRLIDWCRQGPPISRVDDLHIRWDKASGSYDDFTIRYA